MANIPVATVLTVIPSGASSPARVLKKLTAAARWTLERFSSGIGCRVELEPTLTIRPQRRACIPGSTFSTRTRGASTSEL